VQRPEGHDLLRRTRHGVCHRCGWRGMVGKPAGPLRRVTGRRLSLRRLCPECAQALVANEGADSVPGPAAQRRGRGRSGPAEDVA
jgi:hypothetical protein